MTTDDLKKVESDLEIVIPDPLQVMLLTSLDNYPDFELDRFPNKTIVETYRNLLAEGFHGQPWHEHLLPIGRDGSGYTYFIDLHDTNPWLYSASGKLDPLYHPDFYREDCRFGLIL